MATSKVPTLDPLALTSGAIYSHPVRLQVLQTYRDHDIDLFLDGQLLLDDATIEQDGTYRLTFETSEEIIPPLFFTIDRTPPEIRFTWKETPSQGIPQVDVLDDNPHPEGLRFFLDGKSYPGDAPVEPGWHDFTAEARDLAGNLATRSELIETGNPILSSTDDTASSAPLFCEGSSFRYVPPNKTLVAMHYFPWHKRSPECADGITSYWCSCISNPRGGIRPDKGYYGSDEQQIVNSQVNEMIQYGVDILSVEWNGQQRTTNNFLDHVLPALRNRNIQFVLLYDTRVRLAPRTTEDINFAHQKTWNTFVNDFREFASTQAASYFKHPQYFAFGNLPVVYIYTTRAIAHGTAAQKNAIRTAFDEIQRLARNAGFDGLYIVADHIFWAGDNTNRPEVNWDTLKLIKPYSVTSFSGIASNQGIPQDAPAKRPMRKWAAKLSRLYHNYSGSLLHQMERDNLHLINLDPGVPVQYNDHGLEQPQCGARAEVMAFNLSSGTDWRNMLQLGILGNRYIAEETLQLPSCREIRIANPSQYTSIAWIYSYNEWNEGTGAEPLTRKQPAWPYGFGTRVLEIMRNNLP